MSDDIETVYSTEWIPGFNCEAMGYIGRDNAGNHYYAFRVSPQQDEAPFQWSGPVKTAEEARKGMNQSIDRWQSSDNAIWDDWEDRQVAEWEAKGCPQYQVKE